MGLSRSARPATVAPATLTELRAALAAGASPAAALAVANDGPLEPLARAARLGRPLTDLAAEVETGDARTDLLVRALALAERTGTGGSAAVDQALRAAAEEDELTRLLDTHTLQARGTAMAMTAMPAAIWLLLVALDPSFLSFYTRPVGIGTGGAAFIFAAGAQLWSRRILAAAGRAADDSDLLARRRPPRDLGRAVGFALPMLLVMSVAAGPSLGIPLAAAAAAVGLRRPRDAEQHGLPDAGSTDRAGGGAETVELVAVALDAGMPAVAAIGVVAPLAPLRARRPLADAARRLGAGWPCGEAFAGSPLAPLGEVLATTERWGAPAAPALRRLAEDLRAQRRSAAQSAAERTQLALIFPTTLLTLPAFLLGVVPPLLWTVLGGADGFSPY